MLPRVRDSALRVCLDLKLANERCQLLPRLRVRVLTNKPDINAFADGNDEVGLYDGLVSKMGSDAEIAAGLVGVFAYSTDTNPQHYQDSWMQDAGFEPQAMQATIVRMSQLKHRIRHSGLSSTVGFLDTHPSNDRRIAHILSAIDSSGAWPVEIKGGPTR